MSILATFIPVTAARKKTTRNTGTGETSKNDKNGENGKNNMNEEKGENLKTNLAQILYIQYPIIFWE